MMVPAGLKRSGKAEASWLGRRSWVEWPVGESGEWKARAQALSSAKGVRAEGHPWQVGGGESQARSRSINCARARNGESWAGREVAE